MPDDQNLPSIPCSHRPRRLPYPEARTLGVSGKSDGAARLTFRIDEALLGRTSVLCLCDRMPMP